MAAYTFGKQFTFSFYPRDSEGSVLSVSGDAPSIWLYSEKPSRSTVLTETGATPGIVGSEITAWSANGNAQDITIPAVDDPEPNSATNIQDYWLGIKFTLEASEQIQVSLQKLSIERAYGYDVELNITSADLIKYFPQIDDYVTPAQQNDFAIEAIEEIRAEIESAGFEWARVRRPDRLEKAAVYLILANIAISQIAAGLEGLDVLLDRSERKYVTFLKSIKTEYDSSGDGDADMKTQRPSHVRTVV